MDFAAARRNMVDCQILPNRVTDQRLIEALGTVPREAFVPTEFKGVAYVDEAIPLSGGRYLMEPLVTARLIQAAEPKAQDLALVIGCGTGYGAAVLSHLAGTVVAVAVFRDKASYQANSDDPAQGEGFMELRALLEEDPAWEDGEFVSQTLG